MDEIFPKVYAVKHRNFDIRINSRSGGFFTAISDIILKDNGIVYGCILETVYEAVHLRATDSFQRDKMRGSKYIQGNLQNTFKNIQNDLINNRQVLFSGTPCQVAGLKSFLKQDYKNLLCIDIICHGVTSKNIWKKYISYQEKKQNSNCVGAEFRNKKQFDWESHIETLTMINGQISSDTFANIFYNPASLRSCCYKCPYKSLQRQGDISLGDYWGIDTVLDGFNDHKGVSLVIINNKRAEKIFENTKNQIIFKETHIEDCIQKPLKKPIKRPENRENFWADFYNEPFELFICKNVKTKITPKNTEENFRLKIYNSLLEQWLNNRIHGYHISEFFLKKGYQNIAIYGNGSLTKFLLQELKESTVTVQYCIDQFSKTKTTLFNIPVIKINDIFTQNPVNAIIISPIHKEAEIRNDLSKNNINIELISLLELVFNEYILYSREEI